MVWLWYGNHQDHGHAAGRSDSFDPRTGGCRKGRPRVRLLQACGCRRSVRRGGLARNAERTDRRAIVLLARAAELGIRVIVPCTALSQAIRNPARQTRLSQLIRQSGTDLVPLDGRDATAVGLLLAETATADIVDAHVAICARRTGQVVIASDPGDIGRIAPGLRLVAV